MMDLSGQDFGAAVITDSGLSVVESFRASEGTSGRATDAPDVTPQRAGTLAPCMDHVIQRLNLNLTIHDPTTLGSDVSSPTSPEVAQNGVTSSKKKRRRGKKPSLRVFKGTFIHSSWSEPLLVLRDTILGVQDGKIVFIENASSLDSLLKRYKATEWKSSIVLEVAEPLFFIPGFVDSHAHTFPYYTRGIQGDSNSGPQEKRREKCKKVNEDRFTKQVIKDVLRQSLQNGTTSAAWHGTSAHVESAAIILSNFIDSSRQRSHIGVDFNCEQNKVDVQMLHVTMATDVTTTISRMHKNGSRVSASVISTAPLVDWLETKMATIRNQLGIPLKANACRQDGTSRLGDLENLQVLDENTSLTNCCGLKAKDVKMIAEKGAKVVHCPTTDYSSSKHKCIIPAILKKKIKVGLGSDMLNSDSLSMLVAIRNCVQKSQEQQRIVRDTTELDNRIKHLENQIQYLERTITAMNATEDEIKSGSQKEVNGEEVEEPLEEECVPYEEAFRMATLGGASVLGIEEYVGNFEVGKEFDALLIHPTVDDCAFSVYPPHDDVKDILQKFLFTGDDRNILQVYIAGERVK